MLLQSLAYLIDQEEKLVISDYKGNDQGHLDVAIVPCTKDFQPLSEDDFVDNPKEQVCYTSADDEMSAI